MQKEGKPDEVTWHARTAPRLLEFAAAGVFLWGTLMYAMKAQPVAPTKVVEEKKPGTIDITLPSGEVITQPLIPADYYDQPYYLEAGLVEPPTRVTYEQALLGQPAELEGITWKSRDPNEERMRELAAEQADRLAAEKAAREKAEAEALAARLAAEEKARLAAIVLVPTVTYSQSLLMQPTNLEGITWKSGTRPQDRPDQP